MSDDASDVERFLNDQPDDLRNTPISLTVEDLTRILFLIRDVQASNLDLSLYMIRSLNTKKESSSDEDAELRRKIVSVSEGISHLLSSIVGRLLPE